MRLQLLFLALVLALASPLLAQEGEIVANLAGGRVIIHVTRDAILFAAIDHPLESTSVPPRIAQMDRDHIAIFLGASEWQVPSQPKPIRLDREITRVYGVDPRYAVPGGSESDLEQIGVAFLEKLRPLVTQLHHKIDLDPDVPIFQIVLLGYGPKDYGPEIWLLEYHAEQESVSANGDFWKTRVLRPHFTQLYPPEKGAAKTLVEVRYPSNLQEIPLLGLLQQNDPRLTRLRNSDLHFSKLFDQIEHGHADKANTEDAADFLRAALPLIAGDARFFQGTLTETGAFTWVVPPEETFDPKQQRAEDKNRPPEAPTLRGKPNQ